MHSIKSNRDYDLTTLVNTLVSNANPYAKGKPKGINCAQRSNSNNTEEAYRSRGHLNGGFHPKFVAIHVKVTKSVEMVTTLPFHRARFPHALRPCLICNFP